MVYSLGGVRPLPPGYEKSDKSVFRSGMNTSAPSGLNGVLGQWVSVLRVLTGSFLDGFDAVERQMMAWMGDRDS
eukprot:7089111-Prymnesium_polylepis.1